MQSPRPVTSTPKPPGLAERAEDNLRFIRETMERAGSFTAVSGWGQVAIGATALVAAWLSSRAATSDRWLAVWLGEGAIAVAIAMATTTWKVRDARVPIVSGPARKFALSFVPAMIVGAVLTVVLVSRGEFVLLPPVWMLLYGAAVVSAGTFSVRIVPVMGACFMVVGMLALAMPAASRDALMALSFGALHVVFGTLIARRHGG
jgi:hypothetical protein